MEKIWGTDYNVGEVFCYINMINGSYFEENVIGLAGRLLHADSEIFCIFPDGHSAWLKRVCLYPLRFLSQETCRGRELMT